MSIYKIFYQILVNVQIFKLKKSNFKKKNKKTIKKLIKNKKKNKKNKNIIRKMIKVDKNK
jgi:hypothetical protein